MKGGEEGEQEESGGELVDVGYGLTSLAWALVYIEDIGWEEGVRVAVMVDPRSGIGVHGLGRDGLSWMDQRRNTACGEWLLNRERRRCEA